MKLRNKTTGEILDVDIFATSEYLNCREIKSNFGKPLSLAELNSDWEDYQSAEPLIKDKKIRKAVRAWADACYLKEVNFTQGCVFQYGWSEIDFGTNCSENIATGHYTIAELCGDNEE